MIIGAHSILYSTKPEADRAFLRDVLQLTNVDVGDGWLIFGLPPSEVAVHPSVRNDVHEFFLMCDDVEALILRLSKRGITCSPVQEQSWGLLTRVTLPSGGGLGIYQPLHARPKAMSERKAPKRAAKRVAKRATMRTTKRSARKTARRTRRKKTR